MMAKPILATLAALTVFGLTACAERDEDALAVENIEELNAEDLGNLDMPADMNMEDSNLAGNVVGNETDNQVETNSNY